MAVIVDVSSDGVRIESSIAVAPGDALRIELTDTLLLAEVRYRNGSGIGAKLCHSVGRSLLEQCVDSKFWTAA